MGGSGGRFFFGSSDPKELLKKLRDSEAETQDQTFETNVGGIIDSLLPKYNDRNAEAIQSHLNTIRQALTTDVEGTVDLLFGGSVEKYTYIDGFSDIDALVLLNKSELKDMTPQEVREYFFSRLQERLPNTPIEKGNIAVTVKFEDYEIQLLPAVKYKSGFRIADSSGENWSFVKPKEFTRLLTRVNQNMGGKVVPTIKLAKSIICRFPEDRRLSGYHVEALALEVFRQYNGPKITKVMLSYFFREAPKHLATPITDRTGQSMHVDDYLGPAGSLKRKMAADSVGRIGRRMQNADGARLVQEWRDILGIS